MGCFQLKIAFKEWCFYDLTNYNNCCPKCPTFVHAGEFVFLPRFCLKSLRSVAKEHLIFKIDLIWYQKLNPAA